MTVNRDASGRIRGGWINSAPNVSIAVTFDEAAADRAVAPEPPPTLLQEAESELPEIPDR